MWWNRTEVLHWSRDVTWFTTHRFLKTTWLQNTHGLVGPGLWITKILMILDDSRSFKYDFIALIIQQKVSKMCRWNDRMFVTSACRPTFTSIKYSCNMMWLWADKTRCSLWKVVNYCQHSAWMYCHHSAWMYCQHSAWMYCQRSAWMSHFIKCNW